MSGAIPLLPLPLWRGRENFYLFTYYTLLQFRKSFNEFVTRSA